MSRRSKGVLSYLALTFGAAWGLWAIPLRLGLQPRDPRFQLAILPAAFAPALAAAIVRRWVTGEGFDDAGLRPNLRSWRLYLLAWPYPLVVAGFILVLTTALGLAQPDWSLQRALQALGAPPDALPLPGRLLLPLMAAQSLLTGLLATPILLGEEFGWRSYLRLRIAPERPLLAAVATGVIWSLWHLPLNLRGHDFTDHPLLWPAVFTVTTILLSIFFGWLRQRTDSVWAPSLAHAATNAVAGSLSLLLFFGGPNPIFVGSAGALSWLPLGALCLWIARRGGWQPIAERP